MAGTAFQSHDRLPLVVHNAVTTGELGDAVLQRRQRRGEGFAVLVSRRRPHPTIPDLFRLNRQRQVGFAHAGQVVGPQLSKLEHSFQFGGHPCLAAASNRSSSPTAKKCPYTSFIANTAAAMPPKPAQKLTPADAQPPACLLRLKCHGGSHQGTLNAEEVAGAHLKRVLARLQFPAQAAIRGGARVNSFVSPATILSTWYSSRSCLSRGW